MSKDPKKPIRAKQTTDELNPFKDLPVPGQGSFPNYYGAFSIQIFPDPNAPPLQFTHADAGGWIDYMSKFAIPNFWFQDSLVNASWYYEPTDHYLNTYGIDAVVAAYHSGHGGTVDETFVAAMGAAVDDQPPIAFSNQMVLGNQRVNYLFWSTCESLLVNETQNPATVWSIPNRGFRMIFGFNSTSLDDPNYGRYFWEEWQKGKSFSRAWLDATWRIDISMSPSAAAVGGTEEEAKDRFTDERYFQAAHVAQNNYVWGWYDAATAEPPCMKCPGKTVEFEPTSIRAKDLRRLAEQFEMNPRRPILSRQGGFRVMKDGEARLIQEPTGAFEYSLPSKEMPQQTWKLTAKEAGDIAERFIRERELGGDLALLCHRTLNVLGAGNSKETPAVYPGERAVVYAQTIDGVPVISNDAGQLTITIDAWGQVIQVRDTRRRIKAVRQIKSDSTIGMELDQADIMAKLMEAAKAKAMTRWGGSGKELPELQPILESFLTGFILESDQGYFGASLNVEAVLANRFKKRFKVNIPLCKE